MRLLFALGGGDIVNDIRRVSADNSDSGETSITFSELAFRYVSDNDHQALFISHHPRADRVRVDGVDVQHIPKRWAGSGGLKFHLSQIAYGLMLAIKAKRFGAQAAIIDSGTTHSFVLALFTLMGLRVAVNFHNVRWPQGFEPLGVVAKTIRRLDSFFFKYLADGALGCSPECGVQARSDGASKLPYFDWRGQYSSAGFHPSQPPSKDASFHIMFAGRIETNKGVFDILEMDIALKAACERPIVFHICGDGAALTALRNDAAARSPDGSVVIYGRLERVALLERYHAAHAVIVPTRGSFCEGMPLVCAEAMLAGRPVVTSRVSNALPVMGDAIAEAEPENMKSFVAAISRMALDHEYYEQRRAACASAARQFTDPSQGYDRAIARFVRSIATTAA